jgi:hypothetical protein
MTGMLVGGGCAAAARAARFEASNAPVCRGPKAVAKTDKSGVLRAEEAVTLDGTGSTDPNGGKSLTYRWSFTPGPACGTGLGALADITTARVERFRILCTVEAKLTVTDADHHTASDSVTIIAKPRRVKPFTVTSTPDPNGTSTDRDIPKELPPSADAIHNTRGQAFSNCPDLRGDKNVVLCPASSGTKSRHDLGAYSVERIADTGPFANMWYVANPSFDVELLGVTNRGLSSAGAAPPGQNRNIWEANLKAGTQYAQLLRANVMHENDGAPGVAHSGHASSIREAIAREAKVLGGNPNVQPKLDMNRIAEAMSGATEQGLVSAVEARAVTADAALNAESDDPLSKIGEYYVFAWEGVHGYQPEICIVPQQLGSCRHIAPVRAAYPRKPQAGATHTMSVSPFGPNEAISVTLDSAGQIAKGSTDRTGLYSQKVKIPARLAPGPHILDVHGKRTDAHRFIHIVVRK